MYKFTLPIPWSIEQHRNLTYTDDQFKDTIQNTQWADAGLPLDYLTIGLHQLDQPYDWMLPVVQKFEFLKNVKFCFHRLRPGHYLPTHYDQYGYYSKTHNIDHIDCIHRYIVFLEDGKDGHYLTIDNAVYYNWHAGETVGWAGTTPHSALNFGTTDRYTLQITGTE